MAQLKVKLINMNNNNKTLNGNILFNDHFFSGYTALG